MKQITLIMINVLLWQTIGLWAQPAKNEVIIDDNGIMRWQADNSEIKGFGVNYSLPFAHEYRMAQRAGVDHREAIKQDVYHMTRLDLDLYRIHVWDTEISDTLGNLLNNDHLQLFDFTINEMKKRQMKFIITPIAFWGNGWPERDTYSPGFAHKYGKAGCLTHPDAIEAQANYLYQFLNHVNSYTGVAYKDDPDIIAFEISNEPHHGGKPQEVTAYINKMVGSMRKTGSTKPIFYNMTHSIHLIDAYLDANIQGGTFQWYPTNLVANQQINGNFLPHVHNYHIPFSDNAKFKKMAKIVYEFDPADVGGNIMYPAMARAFREAGMQLGAQFAYDALCWAPYNTNYGTHFMNLAYAPAKGISLKIASAVFRHVPLYSSHVGDKTQFGACRISYTDDLAEWVTEEQFFYTNHTQTRPQQIQNIKEIAGCGSSPLVQYSGSGAYFLDKLENGLWRLEVMPDAYWINDPYSKTTPRVQKAAVQHNRNKMTVQLPDLGNRFTAKAINHGNNSMPTVKNGTMELMPGVYLLQRHDVATSVAVDMNYKNIQINEFVAPQSDLPNSVLWNHTPPQVVSGKTAFLSFEAAGPHPIKQVSVVMNNGNNWKTIQASHDKANKYTVNVPAELLNTGLLQYRVMVEDTIQTTTFPGAIAGDPWSWENSVPETFTLKLLPQNSQLSLWDAATDWENSYKTWHPNVNLQPLHNGQTALAIDMNELPQPKSNSVYKNNYAFKFYFANKVAGRSNELVEQKNIVIKVKNQKTHNQPIEVGLIDKNGSVVSATIMVSPKNNLYKIPLAKFKPAPFLVIPRPYPDYMPYTVDTNYHAFELKKAESLQVIVTSGKKSDVNLLIEKIWMEK
jgi:hypothetical protein